MTDLEQTIRQLQDTIAKAAIVNSTYQFTPATRSIFAPENLDPIVKLITPTATPVRAIIPRKQGFGQAAAWKKLTSSLAPRNPNVGGLAGTGVSGFFADASQPNQTTQVYVVVSAPYKNIGRDVEIGRQALASARGYQDERDQQVQIKTLEVMLAEEDGILNGNSSIDPLAFDGLAAQLTTNSGTASLLTASGIGTLVQNAVWVHGATPEYLVCNPRQVQALGDNLQGTGSIQRIMVDNQGSATGGIRLSKIVNPVDGTLIDVISSRYCASNAYLLDVYSPAGERWLEMEDLESLSVYEPPTPNHSVVSRVYETTVLKVIGESMQSIITGLATS
jgi:hypothetical protein